MGSSRGRVIVLVRHGRDSGREVDELQVELGTGRQHMRNGIRHKSKRSRTLTYRADQHVHGLRSSKVRVSVGIEYPGQRMGDNRQIRVFGFSAFSRNLEDI